MIQLYLNRTFTTRSQFPIVSFKLPYFSAVVWAWEGDKKLTKSQPCRDKEADTDRSDGCLRSIGFQPLLPPIRFTDARSIEQREKGALFLLQICLSSSSLLFFFFRCGSSSLLVLVMKISTVAICSRLLLLACCLLFSSIFPVAFGAKTPRIHPNESTRPIR